MTFSWKSQPYFSTIAVTPRPPAAQIEIRPRPQHSFDGRIYAVASSEDSVDSVAKLGAHMIMFSDRPWPMRLPAIQKNRELHLKYHGIPAPHMMITDFSMPGMNGLELARAERAPAVGVAGGLLQA